ncbi:MAG: tetratricopeptide repeat-containing protein [Sphingorhabdus sp.]
MREESFPILKLARAGAAQKAWDAFLAAGLQNVDDDPAILNLKGRLLKDLARKTQGDPAARLFLQSAKAYADSAALKPDSYPLINAATMSFFAGQSDHMALLASQVLALLETGVGRGETAYWHDATKAEAHLLLGNRDKAELMLGAGLRHAPNAWEDHATTLRQLRNVLRRRGENDGWLAAFAPPKSIYFSGVMGLAPDDHLAADSIASRLSEIGAGFAFGALAAGADIMIAEAILNAGGELHIVIPTIPSVFKAQSVAPYGNAWLDRFDSLWEQASSVETIDSGKQLSHAAITLAAEVAKGRAIDNAQRLESTHMAFEVSDGHPSRVSATTPCVIVARSAEIPAGYDMPSGVCHFCIATDSPPANDAVQWEKLEDCYVGFGAQPADTRALVKALLSASPDARIAFDVAVSDDDSAPHIIADNLSRLVRSASKGSVVATASAAMMMKAKAPDIRIEPLGELPGASGASGVYAIGPTSD